MKRPTNKYIGLYLRIWSEPVIVLFELCYSREQRGVTDGRALWSYWCSILVSKAVKSKRLAIRGDGNTLLVLSRKRWLPHKGSPGDL